MGCGHLESIFIPATIEKQEWSIFDGCDNLRKVDVEDMASEVPSITNACPPPDSLTAEYNIGWPADISSLTMRIMTNVLLLTVRAQ